MDYAILRERMVKEQLLSRDIRDEKVLAAFRKVPRHIFVPEEWRSSAYADYPLPIGQNQTISQPYMVALMTQLLELKGQEKVLEIGTGSGYQTAILAELAKEVYSIERFAILAEKAKKTLQELGYSNIKIRIGDGTLGLPENAPFERIIVTAAGLNTPPPLLEQLKEEGIMVIPLGGAFSQELAVLYKKKDGLQVKKICGCVFVPLVGKYGQQEVE